MNFPIYYSEKRAKIGKNPADSFFLIAFPKTGLDVAPKKAKLQSTNNLVYRGG
jgi:hypothetical protein